MYAGTRSFSKQAELKGLKTFSTDIGDFEGIDLAIDILDFTPNMCPFIPDVIWASPPCESFSIASVGHHWTKGFEFKPKTKNAEFGIRLLNHTHNLIRQFLVINPKLIWYVENPRGKMRKAPQWKNLDHVRHSVTYCQYGDTRMKPTDIWTNNIKWQPRPMCKNGMPCHTAAPRGSSTGTQGRSTYLERSKIPPELCDEIVDSSITFF